MSEPHHPARPAPRDARERQVRTASALTLEQVTRRFPGNAEPSVDAVSLSIAPGELLALVGASGSGKTTTLRIAAGYETPDSGRVSLTDESGSARDITREPPQRRGFGMVFQHYALFPHMTVEENVAFGLEARGVKKAERLAKAREALDGVGLGGKAERQVQALSGGEQQRVALARALVISPSVLLLDEPLSNLDPTLRQTMRDELRATLRRSGVTALFVTHDQEDAFAIADRVALLRGGRLLQVGTPETLYDRPASRDVAEFIGRATLVPAVDEGAHATITIGGVARRVATVRPEDGAGRTHASALAVLRPESLALGPADAADAWPGRITSRRFAGGVSVVHVALADGVNVEVATAERGVREGDVVSVGVAVEPVAVVAA